MGGVRVDAVTSRERVLYPHTKPMRHLLCTSPVASANLHVWRRTGRRFPVPKRLVRSSRILPGLLALCLLGVSPWTAWAQAGATLAPEPAEDPVMQGDETASATPEDAQAAQEESPAENASPALRTQGEPGSSAADDTEHGKVAERLESRVGFQTLWAQDKVLAGVTLRFGRRMFFGAFETHLMWTTDRPAAIDRPFLGSQYGLYFEFMPLRTRFFALSAALGTDIFHLWGIDSGELQAALSTKVQAHVQFTRRFGATLGARAYPLSTSGVELGEARNGSRDLPVLMSTGLEWTW